MEICQLKDTVIGGRSRIAFGCFDGMHAGHRKVIDSLIGYESQIPVVLSFEETERPILYSEEEKAYLVAKEGVSVFCSMPEAEASALTGRAFAEEILAGKLRAKSVVCGETVRFGADGAGAEELKAFGEEFGFSVDVVPTVTYEGEAVTTDAVKEAFAAGDFAKVKRLLGHTYVMIGEVVHGKAEGRQHGMPTANLKVASNKMFPPHGVYGTLSFFDGAFYRGLTNIGLRPSADTIPIPTIETFLLDFDRDIYGKRNVLEVHEYIRGVMKFTGGLDEVRAQITKDIANINSYMDQVVAGMKRN